MESAEGACLPGRDHEPEPVTLIDGTTVAHVCRHCMVKLVGGNPYSDDGRPLPTLPDPSAPPSRRWQF